MKNAARFAWSQPPQVRPAAFPEIMAAVERAKARAPTLEQVQEDARQRHAVRKAGAGNWS